MSTKMAAEKPYRMTFTEFAEAIRPRRGIGLSIPSKSPSVYSEWLICVWNSADNRLTYSVSWANDALNKELPPEARQYRFDDLVLHPVTERLGLDPSSNEDNCKVAELLATSNAWISAIQNHYRQFGADGRHDAFTNAAAAEYVLLTSDWIRHPWIQEKVRQYIAAKNRQELEQAGKANQPVEMSSDPNWPGTEVIHARAATQSSDELATRDKEQKDIRYWLEKFRSEDGRWTSVFEVHTWYAQDDINTANQKITALQEIIEKQRALIRGMERIVRRNKRREAEIRASNNIGRPKRLPERQSVALKFTSQWVQSLMNALDVKSCAQLEDLIRNSSQRNWLRWLNGQAVPTSKNLSELLKAGITQGSHKGKPLHDVITNPDHDDLMSLINLT